MSDDSPDDRGPETDRTDVPPAASGDDSRPAPWVIPGVAPAVANHAEREAARRNMDIGRWLEDAIEHALLAEKSGPPPPPRFGDDDI